MDRIKKKRAYSFTEKVRRGSPFEKEVYDTLIKACKFDVERHKKTEYHSLVDGARLTVDGYILPCNRWEKGLVYEVKYQSTRGSANRKFPHEVLNAQKGNYPAPLLFIIDGDFFTDFPEGINTIKWLKEQVDCQFIIGVLNKKEFIIWCDTYKGTKEGLLKLRGEQIIYF